MMAKDERPTGHRIVFDSTKAWIFISMHKLMKSLRRYLVRNLARDYTKGGRKRRFKNKSPPPFFFRRGGSREKPFTEEEKKNFPQPQEIWRKGFKKRLAHGESRPRSLSCWLESVDKTARVSYFHCWVEEIVLWYLESWHPRLQKWKKCNYKKI